MYALSVTNHLTGETGQVDYDRIPDACPICHHAVHPVQHAATLVRVQGNRGFQDGLVQIVFRCTRSACHELFIASYEWDVNHYALTRTAPKTPQRLAFPPEIEELSPRFVEVFNQATAAEAMPLPEIAGMGYRKAVEMLIKDFLIKQDPDARETIEREALGSCIHNRVDDRRLKIAAERAVWVGNDETHYKRKIEDRDVNDLKTLITMTINWIHNVLLTDHYETNLQRP